MIREFFLLFALVPVSFVAPGLFLVCRLRGALEEKLCASFGLSLALLFELDKQKWQVICWGDYFIAYALPFKYCLCSGSPLAGALIMITRRAE